MKLSSVNAGNSLVKVFVSIALLPLTGCYNLLIVNVGVGNKAAAALSAQMTPEAFCAALATPTFEFRRDNDSFMQEAIKMCANLKEKEKRAKP
jgi:hypothetical protein